MNEGKGLINLFPILSLPSAPFHKIEKIRIRTRKGRVTIGKEGPVLCIILGTGHSYVTSVAILEDALYCSRFWGEGVEACGLCSVLRVTGLSARSQIPPHSLGLESGF